MDFRLRVFLSVAKHLSFTRASREIGISQPAITKHIQELENTFRVRLLSRQGGKTALTRHGEILQDYAERIVLEHDLLRMEIGLPGEELAGELSIMSDFRAAGIVASGILPEFRERFPEVNVVMRVMQELPSSAEGRADVILLASQDASGGDAIKILRHEEAFPQAQAFADYLGISLRRRGIPANI